MSRVQDKTHRWSARQPFCSSVFMLRVLTGAVIVWSPSVVSQLIQTAELANITPFLFCLDSDLCLPLLSWLRIIYAFFLANYVLNQTANFFLKAYKLQKWPLIAFFIGTNILLTALCKEVDCTPVPFWRGGEEENACLYRETNNGRASRGQPQCLRSFILYRRNSDSLQLTQ